MTDFFKFEEEKYDFPFYNGIPKLGTSDWIVLLLSIIAVGALINLPFNIESNLFSIIFCLITLIPILYVSRGKLSLFFRMPKLKDIKIIALCVILYYVYAIGFVSILDSIGVKTASNTIIGTEMNALFFISVFIQLMGEELIKAIILLIAMFLIYKKTDNRKLSLAIATAISLLVFGLMHYNSYNGNLIQIIFIIGLGSLIYMYPYLKTKNIIPSYICHVIIDGLIFGATLLAVSLGIDPTGAANLILALI